MTGTNSLYNAETARGMTTTDLRNAIAMLEFTMSRLSPTDTVRYCEGERRLLILTQEMMMRS